MYPLQQKRPISFTCCYINQTRFIYVRFSLTNNIQVEILGSLLEKTTSSIELQHLLEAKTDMPYNLSFLSWSLERSSGNKQNIIKISILVTLHGMKSTSTLLKPADWFYQHHLSLAFNLLIFQWLIPFIFHHLGMLSDCLNVLTRRYTSLEREKSCGILSM